MNKRNIVHQITLLFNLQFIKHSWLDIKRDKAKFFFGISGITISLFILTSIGMLNNTQSYNYVRMVTATTGAADIMITRTVKSDLTFDPYFDQSIITNQLDNVEGVEEFFARIMALVKTSSNKTSASGTLELYGLDIKKEAENGNMGKLFIVDENGEKTNQLYVNNPEKGECVLLKRAAELLNVSREDKIFISYQDYEMDLTVVEICEHEQKFLDFETALILVNLPEAQDFLNRKDEVNYIYGTIENPETVYDASNLDLTTRKLRLIANNVQERLDLNDYTVAMPKLEELEGGSFTMMGTTIVFWFIMILSMLITGILINAILSTSSEERVREFGVLRVVGGKKVFPFRIVLFEGFLMGVVGSVLGITLGLIFNEPISRVVMEVNDIDFFSGIDVIFIILPETVVLVLIIGISVALGVSLLPAIKTSKLDLIKSITPFQSKEEGWEISKEGSMNVKSFLIGISISTIGTIIFILMPRIFITGDFMLIAIFFVGLLAAIVIGLVFASVGIVPLIQSLFLGIVSPAIKKYSNILRISLKRYRRRNTSTVVMFAISFSFIFFMTTYLQMSAENMSLNLRFQYGVDLVIINQGTTPENSITNSVLEEIRDFSQVDLAATSYSNAIDITAALSVLFNVGEEGVGFEEEESETAITDLFQFYASQGSTKYEVRVADIANHNDLEAGFIGIDENFEQLVDPELLIWSSPGSNSEYSFGELFEHNNTCIIAKSIATVLGVQDVGETVRLTFINPHVENDPGNITLFRVAGISGGIPGFFNFRSSESSAYGGGVMVSSDNYNRLMDTPNIGEPDMIVDKIHIKLLDNSEESIKSIKSDIRNIYRERSFIIDDAISKINYLDDMNRRESIVLEIILMFTVLICIFGLISSMYAVFMERKFEIGILRSMGLKSKNIRSMFLIESMIIMLSAGILGTIIGTYSAYLMQTNLGLITEMPIIFDIPYDVLFRVFIISVAVGIVGIYIILIKLGRQSIMDIFRQTF